MKAPAMDEQGTTCATNSLDSSSTEERILVTCFRPYILICIRRYDR